MNNPIVFSNNSAGAQTAAVGKRTFIIPRGTWRLKDVQARLNTAPTGSTFLIDINKNGTSIFTNQADRTTVAISANAAAPHKTQPGSFQGGDRLSYDVDQIGSSVAGSDLDTTFVLEQN
jgi:hypothetical protein